MYDSSMFGSSSTLYEISIAALLTPFLRLYIYLSRVSTSSNAVDEESCPSFFLCVQIRRDRLHIPKHDIIVPCSSASVPKYLTTSGMFVPSSSLPNGVYIVASLTPSLLLFICVSNVSTFSNINHQRLCSNRMRELACSKWFSRVQCSFCLSPKFLPVPTHVCFFCLK
jgi:hypothetical protein